MAFVDIGDQFIALTAGRTQPPDSARQVGIVVDDREATLHWPVRFGGNGLLPGVARAHASPFPQIATRQSGATGSGWPPATGTSIRTRFQREDAFRLAVN